MLCHRMEKRFCFEWQTPGLGEPSSLCTLPFLSSIRYNLIL